jgi:predicted transcriptional regulator
MLVKIKVTKQEKETKSQPKRFTLSLEPDLCATLDKLADEAGLSRHALVVAILDRAVE